MFRCVRQRNDQTCLTQPTRFGVALQATKGTQASSYRFFCDGIGRKLQTNVSPTGSFQIPTSGFLGISHEEANLNPILKLKNELQKQLETRQQGKTYEFPFMLTSVNVKKIIEAYNKGSIL